MSSKKFWNYTPYLRPKDCFTLRPALIPVGAASVASNIITTLLNIQFIEQQRGGQRARFRGVHWGMSPGMHSRVRRLGAYDYSKKWKFTQLDSISSMQSYFQARDMLVPSRSTRILQLDWQRYHRSYLQGGDLLRVLAE